METSVKDESRSPVPGPRALFVDDSEDERELFPLRFRDRFSHYVAVASVAEAIDVLNEGTTEIVFTDIALPDESGLVLARRMREMAPETGGNVPVVAVTGLGAADDLDRAYSAGFTGYLIKPYDNAELLSVVDRVIPSIASLRALRERLRAQLEVHMELRDRAATRRDALEEQRSRLLLRYGASNGSASTRLAFVLASARAFARSHFGRSIDELEIAATRTLADGRESWVVVAICGRESLHVEVTERPGADFVARRLDA